MLKKIKINNVSLKSIQKFQKNKNKKIQKKYYKKF